jgi:hypothetical protein
VITLLALGAAAAHIAFPSLRIDIVTLSLLVVAVLPWLAPIIKSVELPGGIRVEVQDVKAAAEKIIARGVPRPGAAATEPHPLPAEVAQLRDVGRQDPNLAIVGLRIAIEKRLRAAAERRGVESEHLSAKGLVHELSDRGVLPGDLADGVADLLAIAKQAAHGATVESAAADYALEAAPFVLSSLDEQLAPGREAPAP